MMPASINRKLRMRKSLNKRQYYLDGADYARQNVEGDFLGNRTGGWQGPMSLISAVETTAVCERIP
jgi:hypothetical protein